MEGSGRRRVAVVGGGMAGLAAASALMDARPDLAITVFEGSDQVGGKLRLGDVAGVLVDLGAESMLNRRTEATSLARAVGLGDDVVHPVTSSAGVWTRGAVRPLPSTMLGIPTDLAAASRRGILTPIQARRAGLERWLPRLDVSTDVAVGGVVARRLGSAVRDRLVEPLLGGVYAGRADELSLHACLPQVTAALREHGGLLAAAAVHPPEALAPVPVFAGIAGGVARLPQEVSRQLVARGGEVRCGAMVRELEPAPDGGWRLVIGATVSAQVEHVDAVIVASPAPSTARLLQNCAPAAARQLASVEYASVGIITLAFDTPRLDVELAGSGFLVPPADGRVIKACTFSSRKWAELGGDTTVIRCSVGRHREEAVLQRDDSALISAARVDLREAVGLVAQPVDARVTRWGGGLPQYAVGHLDRVARIQAAVGEVEGLEVCGAALDGVGIPAVIASGQAAATRVLVALDPAPTMKA